MFWYSIQQWEVKHWVAAGRCVSVENHDTMSKTRSQKSFLRLNISWAEKWESGSFDRDEEDIADGYDAAPVQSIHAEQESLLDWCWRSGNGCRVIIGRRVVCYTVWTAWSRADERLVIIINRWHNARACSGNKGDSHAKGPCRDEMSRNSILTASIKECRQESRLQWRKVDCEPTNWCFSTQFTAWITDSRTDYSWWTVRLSCLAGSIQMSCSVDILIPYTSWYIFGSWTLSTWCCVLIVLIRRWLYKCVVESIAFQQYFYNNIP